MKKHICIIDDDEDVREILTYALENHDYVVTSYENGKVALEALTSMAPKDYPDMLIIDFMMPRLDGLSLVQILREKYPDTLGKIPLAFSTARGPYDQTVKIPDTIEQLQKPMELDDLLQLVERMTSTDSESYCRD